jgi:hypothetical protein
MSDSGPSLIPTPRRMKTRTTYRRKENRAPLRANAATLAAWIAIGAFGLIVILILAML